MLRTFLNRRHIFNGIVPVVRNARYSHSEGGVPGANLPFAKSIGRPAKLTILFTRFSDWDYGPRSFF
ncbi:hypothetical protein JTB14_035167 [Gonioctena quinquepunctata]|nr:hypothetical protein JTB14_035167 [Gonioctena quinquepunctata]